MGQVFGIDLGTTYSVIATLDENSLPKVIENFADSVPLLASAVYFPEGGDPVVGKEAKAQAEVEPDRVIQFVKRQIGKPDAQRWTFDGVDYDPIKVSSLILKRMKEYAEEQGFSVNDVVITCPAYFGQEEKAATKQAGELAGLNVLTIVNEPTAAALNYCAREFAEKRKMMVYDLGGGTFDITLFDFDVDQDGKASIDILETSGNDRLGGVDWDALLFDHICDLYEEETGVGKNQMDAELRQRLHAQVEDVKQSLSSLPTKSFSIAYAGDTTRLTVTREKFEELTQGLVNQTVALVQQALSHAGLATGDIDVVLMVGGSSLMPMIKAALDGLFPGKTRREEPNLAVAKGAALAAAIKWNENLDKRVEGANASAGAGGSHLDGPTGEAPLTRAEADALAISVPKIGTVSDKLTRSLGPGILDENRQFVVDNLLFIGDDDGAEASQVYGTASENQARVVVRVFENVSRDRDHTHVPPSEDQDGSPLFPDPNLKVKKIGEVELPLPPNTPMDTPIEVFFRSSTIGLEVRATNVNTGESVNAVITSPNTMGQEEFQAAKEQLASVRTAGQISG